MCAIIINHVIINVLKNGVREHKPWLVSWLLAFLSTAETSVALQLHASLISPYDIFKFLSHILSRPSQSLDFVLITNQLAVSRTSGAPTQIGSAAKNCA
jgi:hypothetical protein